MNTPIMPTLSRPRADEPGSAAQSAADEESTPQRDPNGDTAAVENAAAKHCYFVFVGHTKEGRKFRPSDWPDRLRGALDSVGDEIDEDCGDFVNVVRHKGEKAFLVDDHLREIDPRLFRFFMRFAESNHLVVEKIGREDWKKSRG